MNRKVAPFFCDECGGGLSTGSACPRCKRVLCFEHFYGDAAGPRRRRDGLCARCAESARMSDEKTGQA